MAASTASWSRYGTVPSAAPPPPKHEEAVVNGDGAAASAAGPSASASAAEAGVACGEARARARRNLAYFRANYALAALVIVFLGLLYRPLSMLAFLALFVAWLALYFARDGDGDRLACLGRDVDDRVVLAVLSVATVLAVALTHAGLNLLVSLVIAAAVIGVHAAFRMNVYLDERDAFDGGASGSSFYGDYTLPR
uniref:PRA1 family protein n=1 Tax=Leersia perrieri TaxID=77586 RepID=A0A0D9W068_9ORYZ